LPELTKDRGVVGLLQALERLPVVASAMHTTAHPDDEDNGLLVYLSRGVKARTILLSATRGDGGQSLIGPEKFEAMGIVRTGELLAANQYYGAELHFTRAYEFGYSKTAEETLAKWGHEEILADFVRVIRMTRPDVIISRFSGTPRDRHGHHQAAGLLTREAFRAAADLNRFPEQIAVGLRPWQAKKLYLGDRRPAPGADTNWSVKIDLGARDPILGRSYHEIGIEGLSKQRSQGVAGIIPRLGSLESAFTLLDSIAPAQPKEAGFFDGIDTTIAGIAARAGNDAAKLPELGLALSEIQGHITASLAAFNPHHPEATAPHVLAGLATLRKLITTVQASNLAEAARYEMLFALRWKERDFVDAAHQALGIELVARAEDETVIPGQTSKVTVSVHNRGREAIEPAGLNLNVPEGWQVIQTKGQLKRLAGGQSAEIEFAVKVADEAEFTQPYWYRSSEDANRYEVRSERYHTLPYAPPEVIARLDYKAFGVDLELAEPAQAAHINPAVGVEFRDLQVVPAVSVELQPRIAIVPRSAKRRQRQWRVTILNNAPGAVEGTVELQTPTGWEVTPRQATYRCSRKSEAATVAFSVTIPGGAHTEKAQIKAIAKLNGRMYSSGYQAISNPNVWTCHLYRPATSDVKVFAVQVTPGLNVGYLLGNYSRLPRWPEPSGETAC
jgi:LmbE family N-acetylglucosaminyl deacetylase